jgi:integrase
VTAEDVVRWKAHRLASGRSIKTVANDIGELRPIWNWGKQNHKITFAENPFSGIAPRPNKRAARPPRGPYRDDEAARILSAARKERASPLRWFPWLACFTGARLGELVQAVREDVKQDRPDGPHYRHIAAETFA